MIDSTYVAELGSFAEPGALMAELFRRFPGRAAIGTSGQLSGCALIDMAVKAGVQPRVFTIDTRRLFPETYRLFEELEKRYGIRIERIAPEQKELDPMIRDHGEYLFFDTKAKQELCCRVRKVLPNERALDSLDVWITGLRADQSRSRANVRRLEIISHGPAGRERPVLKVAPLAAWTEEKVRAYLKEHNVPVHKLLTGELLGGWHYESLGCILCTTPISPYEPRRAGRWRWFNSHEDDKKECGLHLPPPKP
ncbi:MAG TPA: phosphoadenylyl-sulfate reductase [Elusimicrobiota bacterium]|nr:phosphoadenylyl-sulfate reductase [Elusimicrobiota bacterium]